jgi:RND family efflux transporter MFP subunit
MKPYRLWLALLAVIALAGAGYWMWRSQPVDVQLAKVTQGPAVELVYGTGFVEPRHPTAVSSRVTAPVIDVLVREGDRVRRGQALITLDNAQQRAQLAQMAAERQRSLLDAQRVLKLAEQGWVSKSARDQAQATLDATRAAETAAEAVLQQMVVRAGADGLVLKREVEPGDLATPNKELLQLGNPSDLWITATIDERDVPRLVPGQVALLKNDAWPGRVIRGRLSELTPGGDPLQRAFRARILLDDRAPLPIGMSLEVNLVTREVAGAVLAPVAAIGDGKAWVVQDGRAHRREVQTGIAGGDKVQIVSGLRPGETLIVSPPAELSENARVREAKVK